MSEENSTAPADEAADEQAEAVEAPTTNGGVSEMEAELAKWKAMSKKNEANAKRNAEKAAKFDELEAANQSESEKLIKRVQELESQLRTSEMSVMRSKVAAEKGLEPELAETLTGESAEEMAEHADRLLDAINRRFTEKKSPSPEQSGAGAVGQAQPSDPAALADAVMSRRR